MNRKTRTFISREDFWAVVCLVIACVSLDAHAQRADPLPTALEGVGITEHLNEALPLDLEFTDENGRRVTLGDYFDGERPVILK